MRSNRGKENRSDALNLPMAIDEVNNGVEETHKSLDVLEKVQDLGVIHA